MQLYNRLHTILVGNKSIAENFIYISSLQLFLIIAPLITYPYLVRVIGADLYGVIITAQVLVSYFSIVIDFGSNQIAARYIALNQGDKGVLSLILSSILSARFFIWILCSIIYVIIIFAVKSFREQWLTFLLMYGITFNDLLFPQFFYQGMEKMKFITYVNISIKLLFILLIFIFVKEIDNYILVPLFYSVGYLCGGILSLTILKKQFDIRLTIQSPKVFWFYIKDCLPLLSMELICTIKDKLSYFLIGNFIGMHDVTIYDLCHKFVGISDKPSHIIGTVFLPYFAKQSTRKKQTIVMLISICIALLIVVVANIFLDKIVFFFIHENINLMPIRIILLAPIMLAVSQSIGFNYILANGANKYILWSILVATCAYGIALTFFLVIGQLNTLMSFIFIALLSYFCEMAYRVWVFLNKKAEKSSYVSDIK